MSKIRAAYIIIIFLLAFIANYMVSWNSGFDLGYEAAISDVILGIVDPHEYQEEKYIKPNRKKSK